MGVNGLTGFISSNQELFTRKFELKDISLIIDGSCLLRLFFRNSREERLNFQFGGNYVRFAKHVVQFFGKLRGNRVRPYVIFQGSQNTGITEESTVIKDKSQARKLKELVEYSKTFHEHEHLAHIGGDMNCLLADKVLIDVLKELHIPLIRTATFSDEVVGRLAVKLSCPVFSDDSNFYLCDLKGGFINVLLLDYDVDSDGLKDDVIICRLYERSKLLSLFQLKPEVLPVFSCILGSNFRKKGAFTVDPFSSRIFELRPERVIPVGNLDISNSNKRRILHLLHWLHGHTLETAVEKFDDILDDRRSNRFYRDMNETILKVDLEFAEIDDDDLTCYWSHLNGWECQQSHAMVQELEDEYDKDICKIVLSDTFGSRYLQESWMKDLVDIRALQIFRVFLIIDDYEKPSPFNYSIQLSLYLSAMVNNYVMDDLEPLIMFDWMEDELGKHELVGHKVFPARYIGDLKVPTLTELKFMNTDMKRSILFAMLDSSLESFFETELKMIETHGLKEVEDVEVLSLIVLILRYIQGIISAELKQMFQHFASAITGSISFYMGQDNDFVLAMENNRNLDNRDRLECVYLFNIFQRIVQLFDQINQIFGYPLPKLSVHKFLNGVLVANLYQAYKSVFRQ
ncbi:Protein asteroid -like protein 1 [Halotydeus destructor]|nr:Protein asteroid -like protein 1 [Halotydeus destructor]